MRARSFLLALLAVGAGCDHQAAWLEVDRFEPMATGSGGRVVIALNQSLTVYFSEAVDPLSVTSESFRIADAAGRSVDGHLEIGTRSVRFRPSTPLTESLDDGSFRPGAPYRLELAGMPSSFALRSRLGRPLRRPLAYSFTAARDAAEIGLPTLFLPAGIGDEEFQVDLQGSPSLRLAADSRRLSFRLNMPPLPASAKPTAFRLWRIVTGANAPEQIRVDSVRLNCPDEGRNGGSSSTLVTLELDPGVELEGGDLLFLEFADGDAGLIDFRARPLRVPAALPVKVDPGGRVRARDLDLEGLEFQRVGDVELGFEVRSGRVQPRARTEAGAGRAGTLRVAAGEKVVLVPGGKFECPPGTPRIARGSDLEFAGIDVAPGGELELAPGAAALVLRVTGEVRVGGRIVLRGSARDVPWRSGRSPGVDELARASGVCLVVGGDFVIESTGEIVVEDVAEGSPLTVVVGGTPVVEGRVPPRITLALPAQVRVRGVLEAPIVLPSELTSGVPVGARMRAEAVTQWMPLPSDRGDALDIELEDLRGALRVFLEIAPPDVARPDRPRADSDRILAPLRLPLREALVVPSGAWFRLLLQADVTDVELPSLGGFAVHMRPM